MYGNTAAYDNLARADLHSTARHVDSQPNVAPTAHDDHFASWSLDELTEWSSEPLCHEVTDVQGDGWKFVTENPHDSSKGGGKSCQACINCRKSKVLYLYLSTQHLTVWAQIKCTRIASMDVCGQ